MPSTTRWSLAYPGENDRPEGWTQLQDLAEDVEAALGKAYPVADEAARTALGVAIGVGGKGFTVLQEDTGQPYMWLGASWLAIGGAGGGGGGAAGSRGRWAASTAQTVPNADDANCAFGTDILSTPDIVKTTDGPGHRFTLQRAGVLTGNLTLRYATTTADGVRDCHIIAAYGSTIDYLGSSGGAIKGQPRTHSVGIGPVDLPEDAIITVELFQGTGAPRLLEPGSGGRWVRLALELR